MQVQFKENSTICNLSVAPKNRLHSSNIRIIYRYKCTEVHCEEEFIGKLGRTFGERLKEHLRVPFPIYQHSQAMGHHISVDCFTIIDREAHGTTRTTKEAMYIQVNDPSLNMSRAKYQLLHIGMRSYKTHHHSI